MADESASHLASNAMTGGCYAGYLAEPDDHLWEVAHNPGFSLDEDGTLTLRDFGES